MLRSLSLGTLLLLAVHPLSGQAAPSGVGRIKFLGGAHYVTSTGPTAHLALMRVASLTTHSERGYVVSAEGGPWGGKAGLGTGGIGPFGAGLLRISYLRSWGEDGPVAGGQGYLGADLRAGIRMVAVGVGWHSRVSGDAVGDGSVLTLSAGIGF
jgi:hypothetical protein